MRVEFTKIVEGKFGPQVQDTEGKYYSFSKKYEGDVGLLGLHEVELYTNPRGYLYINSAEPVKNEKSLKPSLPTKTDEAMTRADWDNKDRRIGRAGVIQAAVNAVASQSTLEDLFANAEKLANEMLEFINGGIK